MADASATLTDLRSLAQAGQVRRQNRPRAGAIADLDPLAGTLDGEPDRIVEDRPTEEFFGNPESDRAKDFLSKILNH